ncbi:hypothetical protein [Burkholderia pseudomallei]|uniref:hypothetical protein n=1 Tax=Burkholderia pseudomallei TaxID=28450 RepID=UPI0005311EC5|nr:hypothetical protein [Burkholderia pseudomallei]KGS63065.1 hypothetical protein X990_1295 [Burkholderia pseudomallei MSHR4868]KGW22240.1 hypothetical protein Y602_907 [Burkholderia pseudomallei MSHR733]RAQ86193.1 hypothetical protein A4G85_13965 [Burkholderia pseudomallei]
MPIPGPEERPDLYDGYDCQAPRNPASARYWESVMPDWFKKEIAERRAKAASSGEDAPDERPE